MQSNEVEKLDSLELIDAIRAYISANYKNTKAFAEDIGVNYTELVGALGNSRPMPAWVLAATGYKKVVGVHYEKMDEQ